MSAKDFAEPDNFFRMGAPPVMVDIMPKISGVEFEEAWRRRVDVRIEFAKSLPKRKVLAIGNGEFQSAVVKGITIEQFLLADGFPHPYPGQVDNTDIYNDYGRFV